MDRDSVRLRAGNVNGVNTQKWMKFHMRFASSSTYVKGFVWDRKKPATGPFCTDVDGNVFLDFTSHVASAALGYNHPELVGVMEAIKKVEPDRYAGCDFISGYGEDPKDCPFGTPSHLHHTLMRITKQFGFSKAFFSNSGAEAVENAIKVCYDNRKNRGYGICFEGAFHGRTLGALSLNQSKTVQKKYYPSIPNVIALPFCERGKGVQGWTTVDRKGKESSEIKQLLDKDIGTISSDEVAYIIIEPIQGEGGYRIPDNDFIKEVYRVAHKEGIPIISDEVQTGLGRTGKWWGIEHFSCKPDIITSAKALKVGATLGKGVYFPKDDGRISSTWGEGNAISTALGYKTLEVIERYGLLKNAAGMGRYFLQRLTELSKRVGVISEVRGLGLFLAFDLASKKMRDEVLDRLMKEGILLLGCGYKSIRLLPPLDVRMREIDLFVDALERVLKKVK